MKASDLLVKSLENHGVRYIFGIPGEENLDLLNSLKNSKVRLIISRHEQAAGFMASTIGRLTRKPGVCLSTLGPGATNFTTAAAYATLGGMPMMMITGQKPIKSNKQGKFQIVDIVGMMKPLTKFTTQIRSGVMIPSLVAKALFMAQSQRPGAVHLELPEDIANEDIRGKPSKPIKLIQKKASQSSISKAADLILKAKHPLLLIGASATWINLTDFIDRTGMYFINTQMGKGVIDERHPRFLATAALSAGDYVHCAVKKADLVIAVGHDPVEKPPFIMSKGSQKVIHVNYYPARKDSIYFPSCEVTGDITQTIKALTSKLKGFKGWDFSYFKKLKSELIPQMAKLMDDKSFPIIPQRLVAAVRKAMPEDGIVSLDNGMYKIWFARHYTTFKPNTLLLDNALATMGAGLPTAIATKLLFPKRKVMAVCGDGGFMMNSQELMTAVRLKLDLVILVLNDNGFGMVKWKQKNMGFADFGVDFENPNFKKYAKSYGVSGYRINKNNDLDSLLIKCLNKKGVHLIEVPIKYGENAEVSDKKLCPR